MRIAIVGSGPTALYTLNGLAAASAPLNIIVFEAGELSGTGGPYSPAESDKSLLANIAAIELPPATPGYTDWLRRMPGERLALFGVGPKDIHDRAFLPRVLLGAYLRDQMRLALERCESLGHRVEIYAQTRVVDIAATPGGFALSALHDGSLFQAKADHVVLATGHQWPADGPRAARRFASPWPTTKLADLPAGHIGILGASLSGIDTAIAVAASHGRFVETGGALRYRPDASAADMRLTLMSRKGVLPEADFHAPIPYEPLAVATQERLERMARGTKTGRLDRLFGLVAGEIMAADPDYAERIGLGRLNADSFAGAYFAERLAADPFDYAARNLARVLTDAEQGRVSPYRYAILRLHEAVEPLVAGLSAEDRRRFHGGLAQVFIDNYAAVPPKTVQRLLALHRAGVLDLLRLGPDYALDTRMPQGAAVRAGGQMHAFEAFVDARGQRALVLDDLPFPTLRRQLRKDRPAGTRPLDLDAELALELPGEHAGRIFCAAAPYLLHRWPFAQGLTVCHRLGERVAGAILRGLRAEEDAVDTAA